LEALRHKNKESRKIKSIQGVLINYNLCQPPLPNNYIGLQTPLPTYWFATTAANQL
jgi:hypothetical protein